MEVYALDSRNVFLHVILLLMWCYCGAQELDAVRPQQRVENMNRTSLNELWNRYFQNWVSDSNDDVNLLAAVGSPFPPDVRAVTGPWGRLGRPAVEFTPKSYVGRWAKDLLPIPFFQDFGIKVSLFLQSVYGGVLFNVLQYDHSKSILALNIVQIKDRRKQKIEFIYRNADGPENTRNLVASFIVPRMDRRWTVFSLSVKGQEVTLFYTGCERVQTTLFQHKRTNLAVKANSPLFIGNPGWYIQKPALYGAIFDLTIYKDYRDVIPSCHKDKYPELALNERNGNKTFKKVGDGDAVDNFVGGPTIVDTKSHQIITTETSTTTAIPRTEESTATKTTTTKTIPTIKKTSTTTPKKTTTTTTTRLPMTTTPKTSTTTTSTTPPTTSTVPSSSTTTTSTTTALPTTTTTTTTETPTTSTTSTVPTTTTTTTTTPKTTTTSTTETTTTASRPVTSTVQTITERTSTSTIAPTPYTPDPTFSTVHDLYNTKTTNTKKPFTVDQTTSESNQKTDNQSINELKNEIKKELRRIKEALNKVNQKAVGVTTSQSVLTTTQSTSNTIDQTTAKTTTLSQLEKVREELKNEIEKINSAIEDIDGKNGKTTAITNDAESSFKDITTTKRTTTTTKPNTVIDDNDGKENKTIAATTKQFVADQEEMRKIIAQMVEQKVMQMMAQYVKTNENGKGEELPSGPAGPKGSKGNTGPKGHKGDKGETGLPGLYGLKGDNGVAGVPGNKGEYGEKGMKGEQGKPGPKIADVVKEISLGLEKAKGSKGDRGSPGDQGHWGPPGKDGAKGAKGAKGAPSTPSALKANVILTKTDLFAMEDMFSVGSFAFVASTDNLYIKAHAGWLQVLTQTMTPAKSTNNVVSGPSSLKKIKTTKQLGLLDKRLIERKLIIPSAGVIAKRPYLLLAALNEPHSGNMGGVPNIDSMCTQQAAEAGYYSTKFHAFISDDYNDIVNMIPIKNRKLPVANTRGQRIFPTVQSIYGTVKYTAFNPEISIYSFDQKDVRKDSTWPIKKIWHGSHANGKYHVKNQHCRNWKSKSPYLKATASSINTYTPALNELGTRCDQKLIVLCMQVR